MSKKSIPDKFGLSRLGVQVTSLGPKEIDKSRSLFISFYLASNKVLCI